MVERRRGPKTAESFKVVLIGDKNVGKTSVVRRYIEDVFDTHTEGTIGASFFSKVVQINTGVEEEPVVPIKL